MSVAPLWILPFCWILLADTQSSARIDGIVLDDASGVPVGKAVVMLDPGTGSAGTRFAAVTDAEGRFSMEEVDPAKYGVTVERAGYLNRPWPIPLNVLAGDRLKGITLKITRHAIIAGKVTTPAGSSGIANTLQFWKTRSNDGYRTAEQLNPVPFAGDGSFVLGDLAPGRYLLEQPSLGVAHAIVLDVTAGSQTRGIQIRPRTAVLCRISGVARNPAPGRSMPDGRVYLEGREPSGSWVPLRRSARINRQTGAFTFTSVPPGDYRISAQITVQAGGLPRDYFAAQEVHVEGRSATGISLPFSPMAVVTGTLSEEVGLPVRTQPIFVGLRGDAPDTWPGASIQVLPKRAFRLQVRPGAYRVYAGNFTENNRTVKAIRFNDRDTPVDALLKIPAEGGKLDVLLGGPGREIAGIVRDHAGRSSAGARVAAWSDGGEWTTAETDALGRFTIRNAPRGQVYVAASEYTALDPWSLPSLRTAFRGATTKIPAQSPMRVTVQVAAMPRQAVEAEVAKLR